jgi:hypothetical protein
LSELSGFDPFLKRYSTSVADPLWHAICNGVLFSYESSKSIRRLGRTNESLPCPFHEDQLPVSKMYPQYNDRHQDMLHVYYDNSKSNQRMRMGSFQTSILGQTFFFGIGRLISVKPIELFRFKKIPLPWKCQMDGK